MDTAQAGHGSHAYQVIALDVLSSASKEHKATKDDLVVWTGQSTYQWSESSRTHRSGLNQEDAWIDCSRQAGSETFAYVRTENLTRFKTTGTQETLCYYRKNQQIKAKPVAEMTSSTNHQYTRDLAQRKQTNTSLLNIKH